MKSGQCLCFKVTRVDGNWSHFSLKPMLESGHDGFSNIIICVHKSDYRLQLSPASRDWFSYQVKKSHPVRVEALQCFPPLNLCLSGTFILEISRSYNIHPAAIVCMCPPPRPPRISRAPLHVREPRVCILACNRSYISVVPEAEWPLVSSPLIIIIIYIPLCPLLTQMRCVRGVEPWRGSWVMGHGSWAVVEAVFCSPSDASTCVCSWWDSFVLRIGLLQPDVQDLSNKLRGRTSR